VVFGSNGNHLRADKLRLKMWLSIREQHGRNLAKVCPQFIERRTLRVRAGPTRDVAHEQACFRIALDDRGERPHASNPKQQVSDRQCTCPVCWLQVGDGFSCPRESLIT
jgi:hypothetical protein